MVESVFVTVVCNRRTKHSFTTYPIVPLVEVEHGGKRISNDAARDVSHSREGRQQKQGLPIACEMSRVLQVGKVLEVGVG